MKTITESVNKGFENKYGQLEMGYKGSRKKITEGSDLIFRLPVRLKAIKSRLDFVYDKYDQGKLSEKEYSKFLTDVTDYIDRAIQSFEELK